MVSLSLRELKEYLINKEGYTISPKHSQLNDLKDLVNDMLSVRNQPPPATGSGYNSGTNCIGHSINNYSGRPLSLGDIKALDIKDCSCHVVNDTTAYCRSRTYLCSCNSNAPVCTCNSRSPVSCDCQSRTMSYTCLGRGLENGTTCVAYVEACSCNSRTSESCNCQSRTSSCGSRDTTSCTCNGRCACNSEKRFE